MPFEKLLKFTLSMYKTSSQTALNKFFENENITITQQALSKVQNKFNHTPFLKLFDGIRNAFYEDKYLDGLAKFYNKLIIAVDGSETPLPNLPALREKSSGAGAKASSPIVRMSIAYDGLNGFIIGAAFFLLTVSERSLCQKSY